MQARQGPEIIENPRILCAANKEFAQPKFGFEHDVTMLKAAFPNHVQIEKGLPESGFATC
jgi:hypothetical protein